MKYTALAAICLLTLGANAGFTIKDEKRWFITGCNLKIDNVCGCNKKLNINYAYRCDQLPKVHTHGRVCGGHWTLQTAKNKKPIVQFSNGRCGRKCDLGKLEHGASCG